MYKNTNSNIKAEIRDYIYNKIEKVNPTNCLTLPNLNFDLENKLSKISKVHCLEIDKNIYKQQKKLASNNITIKNKEAFDYLKASKEKFGGLWLDFCGSLTPTIKNNLLWLVQSNKLEKEAIIAITLLRGRECYAQEIVSKLKLNYIEEWRR